MFLIFPTFLYNFSFICFSIQPLPFSFIPQSVAVLTPLSRYSIAACSFEHNCTITEQELVTNVLPSLTTFLTARSLSQLNFSRCCLFTDSVPKAIVSFENGLLCRRLRALHFDFCYALTDKSLEILLSTSLPFMETLSLRCARSRDLTGAPFSQKNLLTKARWPRFHQFSCSCTQMALPHLDAVSVCCKVVPRLLF